MIRAIEHYKAIAVPDMIRKQHLKSFLSVPKIECMYARVPLNLSTTFSIHKPVQVNAEFFERKHSVTCSMLALESLTRQKSTLKVFRRRRQSQYQKNHLFSAYTTLRKRTLGSFIDLLVNELLPTSFQFEPLRFKKIKNVNVLNFRTDNFLSVEHTHESLTSLGPITLLATPFIAQQQTMIGGKFLLSLYQVPFRGKKRMYYKSL